MKARRVVFTGPCRAELEEFEVSEELADQEALVRNCATLISPGTELAMFTDDYEMPLRKEKPYPMHVGYAAVGEALAVGEKVTALKPGDLVFTPTRHASAHTFNVSEGAFVRIPEKLSAVEAIFCRMVVVSMSSLTSGTARPGDWVAICGLGLVGNLAAQAFRLAQMRVIVLDPSAFRRRQAEACGIEHVFDPNDPELKARVDALSAPAGCSIGLDCTGKAEAVVNLTRLLAQNAELVLVGTPWQKRTEVSATEVLQAIFFNYLHVRSGWEWHLPPTPTAFRHGSLRQNYLLAMDWIANGDLKVAPLLTHRFAPEMVQQAYEGLLSHPDSHLGVVLEW